MKKILIASTALVATAGMAAAEINWGGFGRFGVAYSDNGTTDTTTIEQRFRLTVTGIAETDSGVKFEGRIRFQSDEASDNDLAPAANSAAGFAASYGGFRLDVGAVSDVFDSGDTVDIYGYGIGLLGNDTSAVLNLTTSGFGSSTSDKPTTVKFRYTAGDLTVNASYIDTLDDAEETVAAGIGYNFGNFNLGAGYGETDGVSEWAISGGAALGEFNLHAVISDTDADSNGTRGAISGMYAVSSATEIRGLIGDNGASDDSEVYAIGFRHSLGGGVSLRGGIGEYTGTTKGDLGVIFNF